MEPADRYVLEAMRYEGALRRSLLRMTGNKASADELLHDIYVALLKCGRDGQEIEHIFSFAIKIAKNKVTDEARRTRVAQIEYTDDTALLDSRVEPSSMENQVDAQQALDNVQRALEGLSPLCWKVVELSRFSGLSYEEISSRLGISFQKVKYELERACERLKQFDPYTFQE